MYVLIVYRLSYIQFMYSNITWMQENFLLYISIIKNYPHLKSGAVCPIALEMAIKIHVNCIESRQL